MAHQNDNRGKRDLKRRNGGYRRIDILFDAFPHAHRKGGNFTDTKKQNIDDIIERGEESKKSRND